MLRIKNFPYLWRLKNSIKKNPMSLVKCPDCGSDVSDRANFCPHCGCPLDEESDYESLLSDLPKGDYEKQRFPDLPLVTDIGKPVDGGCHVIPKAYLRRGDDCYEYFRSDFVTLSVHANGIRVSGGQLGYFNISCEQITGLYKTSREILVNEQKSVIGRAVVGKVLFGDVGAVVGGMSGLGTKQKSVTEYTLTIEFWDVYSHRRRTLTVKTYSSVAGFVKAFETQKEKHVKVDGGYYVCNIVDDNGALSEGKAMKALEKVGEKGLACQIAIIEGTMRKEALEKVRDMGSARGIDTKIYKRKVNPDTVSNIMLYAVCFMVLIAITVSTCE